MRIQTVDAMARFNELKKNNPKKAQKEINDFRKNIRVYFCLGKVKKL